MEFCIGGVYPFGHRELVMEAWVPTYFDIHNEVQHRYCTVILTRLFATLCIDTTLQSLPDIARQRPL